QLKICKGEPKEQSQIIAMLNTLDKEIGFIFRESQRRDKHYHEMAKHQERRLLVKKLVAANAQPQSQAKVANTPALVHLKQFLKANYDPNKSLEENIKRFFQDPYIKGMLHLGGPIGGIEKLNDPHAVWIFKPDTENDYNGPGVYNQEIIDYYVQQLKLMVEAEAQHPGSYPLYNAMGGNLCVGNDIIRELSSLLNFKEYGALFRLFSDDFNYPDAQSFREDIYDRKHLVDDGPDFHKRGMACALSPFQAMQEESALDFWSHNRNVQGFNRWEKEILPKLKEIVTDPKDIEELKRRHEELIQLSQQIGARMHQFLIPKEEVDKYTWISGAYGFQVPAAMRGGETTHHLSNAMDYYVSSPEGFIQDTEQKRKAYFEHNQDPHFQAKKGKVYDTSYSEKRDRERHLAQLQARLYLHPDLFEPGKMEVNTYYSGNPPPQLVAEYNLKVRQFSQRLAGIIIEAKDQNRLQAQKAPHDLLQTIIPLRDLKNAPNTKLEAAKQKLQELVDLGVIDLPSEVQGSDLYKAISRITQMSPMPSNYISLISSELTKQSKSTDDKRNQLSACFYYAIANGDVKTFEALMSYYQSAEYDYKKFPIDFDNLSNGSENASAMVLACKNNRTDMINKLISIRNDSFWSKWAWNIITSEQPSVNIRRTATESETANQPLHYLAQHANVEAFKQMIESMIKSRNLPSYFYNQGVTLNANNNTPLHILAMNQPNVQHNRLEILRYLLADNKGAFDTLFGNNAILTPNNQGISPIMMAALSQNPQAIKLFAQNCGLSNNQTQIYLWISQDPAQRLPQVLNEINEYGTIPGFVPRGWKVPSEIIDNKRDLDEPSLNPPSKISALITQFNEALNKASNKEAIHSAYEEIG
ncbi:MAG: ankyrin repeat domain-containing protein, partial [Candidatus Berkiella sp.]